MRLRPHGRARGTARRRGAGAPIARTLRRAQVRMGGSLTPAAAPPARSASQGETRGPPPRAREPRAPATDASRSSRTLALFSSQVRSSRQVGVAVRDDRACQQARGPAVLVGDLAAHAARPDCDPPPRADVESLDAKIASGTLDDGDSVAAPVDPAAPRTPHAVAHARVVHGNRSHPAAHLDVPLHPCPVALTPARGQPFRRRRPTLHAAPMGRPGHCSTSPRRTPRGARRPPRDTSGGETAVGVGRLPGMSPPSAHADGEVEVVRRRHPPPDPDGAPERKPDRLRDTVEVVQAHRDPVQDRQFERPDQLWRSQHVQASPVRPGQQDLDP